MQLLRCACPQCGTALRVKDRAYLGRPVPCPDCRTLLVLKVTDADQLAAERADVPAEEQPKVTRPDSVSPWMDRLKSWATNVTVVSWTATCVVAALIAAVAFWPKPRVRSQSAATRSVPLPVDTIPPKPIEPEWMDTDLLTVTDTQGPVLAIVADSPETRLEHLGQRLHEYHEQHHHWPTEQPPASFLTVLMPALDQPANLQPVPDFLNPLVKEIRTPDGDAMTHFVGVAGVGADAAELPVDHPRAGIFGTKRKTTSADVMDGLSHTLLMLGVETQLGAWTAAGPATVRPLTREPYLHGPDGFGTAQDDGMFALLADGSVKFLAADTHPVIMRRMAAMADGLPLDLSVPGDPAPWVAQSEPALPNDLPPAGLPVDTPPEAVAESVSEIDFDAALNQPLQSFRQDRAVPRRDLLDLMEEMLGAPIRYDVKSLGSAADALDRPVSLDLQDVTVEEVLRQILDKSDLIFVREKTCLRLQRTSDPASAPDKLKN